MLPAGVSEFAHDLAEFIDSRGLAASRGARGSDHGEGPADFLPRYFVSPQRALRSKRQTLLPSAVRFIASERQYFRCAGWTWRNSTFNSQPADVFTEEAVFELCAPLNRRRFLVSQFRS